MLKAVLQWKSNSISNCHVWCIYERKSLLCKKREKNEGDAQRETSAREELAQPRVLDFPVLGYRPCEAQVVWPSGSQRHLHFPSHKTLYWASLSIFLFNKLSPAKLDLPVGSPPKDPMTWAGVRPDQLLLEKPHGAHTGAIEASGCHSALWS